MAQTPLEIKATPMPNVYSRSQRSGQAGHVADPFHLRQTMEGGSCVSVQSRLEFTKIDEQAGRLAV